MARKRLAWHLLTPYTALFLAGLLVLGWFSIRTVNRFHYRQSLQALETYSRMLASQLAEPMRSNDRNRVQYLCRSLGRHAEARLTAVSTDGDVWGDSREDPGVMGDHANRPEIARALRGRLSVVERYSPTRRRRMLYVAVPVSGQGAVTGVARASLPVSQMQRAVQPLWSSILVAGGLTALAGFLLAAWISRQNTIPLREMQHAAEHYGAGDFSVSVPPHKTRELHELGTALNRMALLLDQRLRDLQRQKSEQEALLEGMVEGVLAVSLDEKILTINREASKLARCPPAQARGRSLQEVVRNVDLQAFVRRVLATREPIQGDIVFHQQQQRHLRAHGSLLRDDTGDVIGGIVVLHDITELKRLENLRREFVANVSHELRTPITSIIGFVETLQRVPAEDTDARDRFLAIIDRQTHRLDRIVEDLLSLCRIESSPEEQRLEMRPCPLRGILESAVQTCQHRAGEKHIVLTLACPANLQATVHAAMIEQAVVNLLDNAVNYSDPHTEIHLEGSRDERGVRVSVRDHGCGIAPQHQARLFERFYRVDKNRSRKLGGTGLGLAIVKHIVQSHGGTVDVESKPGEGSCFFIRLPRA